MQVTELKQSKPYYSFAERPLQRGGIISCVIGTATNSLERRPPMSRLITAIAVAAGILIMPNVAQAAGTFSSVASTDNPGQVLQIKETRRHNSGRQRKHRSNRHNRHAGGNFHFGSDYYDGHVYRSCRFLKRKARYSGSRYWWNKYRNCMDRRYY